MRMCVYSLAAGDAPEDWRVANVFHSLIGCFFEEVTKEIDEGPAVNFANMNFSKTFDKALV